MINYDGSGETRGGNHLSFKRDDIITLVETTGNWWEGEFGEQRGIFPKVFVKEISEKEAQQAKLDISNKVESAPSAEKSPIPLHSPPRSHGRYERTGYSFESSKVFSIIFQCNFFRGVRPVGRLTQLCCLMRPWNLVASNQLKLNSNLPPTFIRLKMTGSGSMMILRTGNGSKRKKFLFFLRSTESKKH